MAATGELIRLINYVDDINTTLRRISASIPLMDAGGTQATRRKYTHRQYQPQRSVGTTGKGAVVPGVRPLSP